MSDKGVDEGITTRAGRTPEQRAVDARAEHTEWCAALQGYPCNCSDAFGLSGQRVQDTRDAEADTVKLNEVGLILLERRITEQSAIIVGQRAAIEALREMVEDMAQGHRHLAGRIDKAEQSYRDEEAHRAATDIGLQRQIDENLAVADYRFHEGKAFKARVIAAYPLAGTPTMQKMCDDVEFRGPTEEDERE